VTVEANDLKGGVLCYPEYDAAFPESWSERETRYREIIAQSAANPVYAAMAKIPKNLRVMADNARMSELAVPGEQAVKKQLSEIEQLTQSGPVPNPEREEIQQQLETMQASGQPVPPELQKQVDGIPPLVSSVPVAMDASEDHPVEAQTCFEWMNDEEVQKFKNGTAEQQAAFQNVYLHWKGHTDMATKLTQQPTQIPPRLNISMKDLPASGRTQAAAKTGLMIPPQEFEKKDQTDMQRKIHERVVPKVIPETYRKLTR